MRAIQYPSYKKSGIDWVERIPEEWEIKKVKHFARIITGTTPDSGNEKYWDGDIVWVTPADLSQREKYISDSRRKITKEGYRSCGTNLVKTNSVILATRAPIGYATLVKSRLCFNQGCKALEIEKDFFPDYVYYYLNAFEEVLISRGNATTFSELGTYELGSFEIVKPSMIEQQKIVKYLDIRISKINDIINRDAKLIELLSEKRIELIDFSVTKGFDNCSKLKDSGIEWIGRIPENWSIKKVKFLGNIVLGKMLSKEEDGGYAKKPYLRAQNILWEKVDTSDVKEMWFSRGELKTFRLNKNDLLVSEGGEAGRTAIWEDELQECYIQNSVNKVALNDLCHPRFMLYLFEAYGSRGYFESIVSRVSIAHLTREKLKEVPCILPPKPEQVEIAKYLDVQTAKIDKIISIIQERIDLLQEYKKSLINNVVTGKMDVRAS